MISRSFCLASEYFYSVAISVTDKQVRSFFKVVFPCRNESCKKSLTRFNHNKHVKLKGHTPETSNKEIPCDEKSGLFKCPTTDIKHLKSCCKGNKNKEGANESKI